MKHIWIEILKFFKNNIIKIFIGTIMITLGFVGLLLFQRQSIEEDDFIIAEAPPASFFFYLENEDGSVFTNHSIIDEYVLNPEILHEASESTNTNLAELVEDSKNTALVNYTNSGETTIIRVTRNMNSNLHEFRVNIGNEDSNLRIADYYYSLFLDGSISFLKNKDLHIFQSPELADYDKESVPTFEVSIDDYQDSLITQIIIGLIFGLVVSVGVLVINTLTSKKIKYSFSYNKKADDYFVLIDKKINNINEVTKLLAGSTYSNKALITNDTDRNINKDFQAIQDQLIGDKTYKNYDNVFEIENSKEISQLIYIIKEDITSREWYNEQRKYDELLNIPTIIIQVNQD